MNDGRATTSTGQTASSLRGWQGTRSKDEHIKLARIAIDIHPELDDLFRIVNKNKVHFPEQLRNHLKTFVNPKVTRRPTSCTAMRAKSPR